MPFEIKQISETSHLVELGEKLWLKDDGVTLVADGDPEAAHLFGVPGDSITREEAERVGLVKAEKKAAAKPDEATSEPATEEKPRAKRSRSRSAARKKSSSDG